ncbi:splicing factor 1-like isoform X2 [Paramuricea clavata]|nr:splicing factor 1-like isoform X2 [Paramuricea clavata]
MIRGKGSVKDGKGRKDGQLLPGEDEILHALITGQNHESVKKCVDLIKTIIKQGVDAPEGENSLKKLQLRELAALNGTLRDEEIVRCRNCGSSEHKHWECPEQPNFTATLTCTKCGSSGHIAMDCTVTQQEITNILSAPPIQDSAKMDSEVGQNDD